MLIAGVPVFIALAGSSLIYTHFLAGIPDFVILHRMAGGIDSFPPLVVPFFILAGNLMNSAGITNRIYAAVALRLDARRPGARQHHRLGIFAGMNRHRSPMRQAWARSRSAMKDHGYGNRISVGVTAASATLGPIIPPRCRS